MRCMNYAVTSECNHSRSFRALCPSLLLWLGSAFLPVNLLSHLWSRSDGRYQLAARERLKAVNGDSDIYAIACHCARTYKGKTPSLDVVYFVM